MTPLPKVIFTSALLASRLLRWRPAVTVIHHVLSIGSPDSKPPVGFDAHPARKLRLVFDDLEVKAAHKIGRYGPTPDDALALVTFFRGVDPEDRVLIHCAAGVSRSAAAALVLLAMRRGDGQVKEAVADLLRVERECLSARVRSDEEGNVRPNRRLVSLCDDELGMGGALLDACQDELNKCYWGLPWMR